MDRYVIQQREHQSKRVRVQADPIGAACHFRFWHKADIKAAPADVIGN
jgi:hypothetical protein